MQHLPCTMMPTALIISYTCISRSSRIILCIFLIFSSVVAVFDHPSRGSSSRDACPLWSLTSPFLSVENEGAASLKPLINFEWVSVVLMIIQFISFNISSKKTLYPFRVMLDLHFVTWQNSNFLNNNAYHVRNCFQLQQSLSDFFSFGLLFWSM